jgi:hypothetical protein
MSSRHGGRGLDRWQPSLKQNEDQSPHAWCVDAERGWWRGTGADVVAVDKGALRRRDMELVEQLSQPSGLSHAVGNGMILGLSAGAGYDGLPLGRPGNQVVP